MMSVDEDWVVRQTWRHLFFLNFTVDQELLRQQVPSYLELDNFAGKYYTSIVPFQMSRVQFPFSPVLPFSTLSELNLRTYVTYEGVRGIYFFTLDSNHRLANFVANKFFHLPYRYDQVQLNKSLEHYSAKAKHLTLEAKFKDHKDKSELDTFLVERYSLFTDNGASIYRGQVFHEPWALTSCDVSFEESMHERFALGKATFDSSFYARGFDVFFKKFQKIGSF